jgi:pimeloyl-ACP methyl ester carboxylesterase
MESPEHTLAADRNSCRINSDLHYDADVAPSYPIVYVRGYAFSDREVEETSDDPTNGFNIGSTHARQGVGKRPLKYPFPGPFVRLMTDYGYRDVMHDGVESVVGLENPRRTLWIHRYYEPYSDRFGDPGLHGRPAIVDAAVRLKELIETIRFKCFGEADHDRRVILIAHSMGGLVCRSLIQRVLREPASNFIAKVVTYGTPHGGIPFARSWIPFRGLSNFTHPGLFACLAPEGEAYSRDFDPQKLLNFPADQFLCVVGTDYSDYLELRGWARRFTGPGSDGLVPETSAWVEGAPRVYVHRSHSGRYGLVSSAEAFYAVERFLFGDLQASLRVGKGGGPSPPHPIPGRGGGLSSGYRVALMDVECMIGERGLRVTDRRADYMSALRLPAEGSQAFASFGFLREDKYQFALSLRIRVDHYEGETLVRSEISMQQSLRVWITAGNYAFQVLYQWLGEEPTEVVSQDTEFEIQVPASAFSNTWEDGLTLILRLSRENENLSPTNPPGGVVVSGGFGTTVVPGSLA